MASAFHIHCLKANLHSQFLIFKKKKKTCDRRLLRWLPSILTSQYLQPCIIPYRWTWAGPSDLLLMNRIWQEWHVSPEIRWQKDFVFCLACPLFVMFSCSDGSQLPCSEMLCGEVHLTGNWGFLATAESPSLTTCKELSPASNMFWVRKGLLPSLESWDDPRQHFDYSLCGTLIHTQITQKPEINKSCIKLQNLEVIH